MPTRRLDTSIRAFTLVELVMVIGVLVVLLGIALPVIGRSRDRAKETASLAAMGNDAAIVQNYCSENRGVFPIAHANAFTASERWEHALTTTGHLPSPQSADPVGSRGLPGSLVDLSVCLVYDADRMVQGYTLPMDQAASTPVADHQVLYPSDKGMLIKRCLDAIPNSGNCFCCARVIRVPIAMVDGSVLVGARTQFAGGAAPVVIDGIGTPVYSSWGGFRAKDRL
jgi:type II secretory pathway pseudopilin PulG